MSLVIASACATTGEPQENPTDPRAALERARALLAEEKEDEAGAVYQQIPFQSPEWQTKFVDILRHQIASGRFAEAYRLVELARTLGLDIEHLTYYRALVRTRQRGCPLELDIDPYPWKLLIAAHTYRFGARYQTRQYDASPFSDAGTGPLHHHLAQSQFHHLADIPRVTLVPGGGCWLYEKRLSDPKMRDRYEFEALLDWYNLTLKDEATPNLPGASEVKLRLMLLAGKLKDEKLERDLLYEYQNLTKEEWLQLREPERSFIYGRLIAAQVIPAPPFQEGTVGFDTALHIINNSDAVIASRWSGLLDWERLSRPTQNTILDHLLALEGMTMQQQLMYLRARNDYLDGKIYDALRRIRAIYRLETDGSDILLDEYIVQMMVAIMSEYRYDPGMLGAIHAALPRGLWIRIIKPVMLDDAVTGNRRGYDLLMRELQDKRGLKALRIQTDQLAFLDALARRQASAYATSLSNLAKQRRLAQGWINLFRELAERVIARGAETDNYRGYLVRIARLLEEFIGRGHNVEVLQELLPIFDPEGESRYGQGQATVQGRSVNVGAVRLDDKSPLRFPFAWNPPTELEKRDLLVVPDQAINRAWLIR